MKKANNFLAVFIYDFNFSTPENGQGHSMLRP
jgi:hypothetical protein